MVSENSNLQTMNIIDSTTTFAVAKATLEKLFKLLSSVANSERITLENQKGIAPYISTMHLWKEHPFGDFEITFFEPESDYLFLKDSRLLLQIHWSDVNQMATESRDPQGVGQTEFLRIELFAAHLNTGREKRRLLGPDTTVFLRNELLSVNYYFNQGRVAREIRHNGVPLEEFPDGRCITVCPAVFSLVKVLELSLEQDCYSINEAFFNKIGLHW